MATGFPRGTGSLSEAQQEQVLTLLRRGCSQTIVAAEFGVKKSVISGVWQRYGEPVKQPNPTADWPTVYTRCDVLHAKMDVVLKATKGIGRLPNEPKSRARG